MVELWGLSRMQSDFLQGGSNFAYDFMFALQAISWGVIPYLIAKRKSKWPRVGLAVLVSCGGNRIYYPSQFCK